MKNVYLAGLCAVMLLFSSQVWAQSTPEKLVSQFFQTLEASGTSKALDDLYATNVWMDKAQEAILNLKNQMATLTEDYVGKYHGYEPITKRSIADSYVLMSYLVRYDRQPLRFTFQFYKPQNEWRVYSFKYDAGLDDELEEAAKIYFLD